MLQLIQALGAFLRQLIAEVTGTLTSRERLRQLFRISLYRNAAYLMVTHLTAPLAGFVFWIIAARFYSAEDVGVASAAIAAMLLLVTLSTLGLDFALVRFLPSAGQSAHRMVNSSLTLAGMAGVVLSGIFVAGVGFWSPGLAVLRQSPLNSAIFIAAAVAATLSVVVGKVFVARRRAGFMLASGLVASSLRLPLPILLAASLQSFGIFTAWAIAVLVSLIIGVLVFVPRIQPGYRLLPVFDGRIAGKMMRFSLANYVGHLFWVLPGLVFPIMVLNILGAEANAYFYIAWAVGGIVTVIPLAVATSLFAEGSHDERTLTVNAWRSLKLTFLIIVPAAAVLIAVADKVLILFGGSYSESGVTLVRIAVLATFPIAINHIYLSMKRVQSKLVQLVALSVFIAVAALLLSYLLLPRLGINGVGVAWVVSQGVVATGIVIRFAAGRPAVREALRGLKYSLRRRS